MKNQAIFLQFASAAAGTYLLYGAGWGLNALLLVMLVLLLLAFFKRLPLLPSLLFAAAGVLVGVYGSLLASVLYVLLLLMLISHAQSPLAWPLAIVDGLRRSVISCGVALRESKSPLPGYSFSKSLLMALPALAVFLLFYGLYSTASPAFAEKISLAHLQLPEFSWFVLFFLLSYFSFAFVRPLPPSALESWQAAQTTTLLRQRTKSYLNPFWLKYEYKTALLVLGMLNVLLLVFHLVDAATLTTGKPDAGVSYAEWVHQGVGTLILSIVLAVALLLYVFRGNLNFFRHNRPLQVVAKGWILQNMLLVLSTALKNGWYIAEYGLTYKRIGVGVYLVLVLVGLFTSWQKISNKHTLWWMFTGNFKAALLVLLITACFPWARLITSYNLKQANVQDIHYLLELPLHNTDQLARHAQQFSDSQRRLLQLRQEQLLTTTTFTNWKSWTLLNYYATQQLEESR